MGRHSGFIACYASLAMSDANFVLIPEVPVVLDGDNGFLKRLHERLIRRKHAVVVVAEGPARNSCTAMRPRRTLPGNLKLEDIGPFLRDRITAISRSSTSSAPSNTSTPATSSAASRPARPIRSSACASPTPPSTPPCPAARGMVVGIWHGRFVHVPMQLAIRQRQTVDTEGDVWQSVLESTGQPRQWK